MAVWNAKNVRCHPDWLLVAGSWFVVQSRFSANHGPGEAPPRTSNQQPATMLRKVRAMMHSMPRRTIAVLVLAAAAALPAHATDALEWSGFALLRGAAHDDATRPEEVFVGDVPLDDDLVSAQLQLGLDWRPNLWLGGHLHLMARSEGDDSRRGRIGVVQAYVDQSFERGPHRLKLTEGAFFLPTSRENVDALWESPYTITSSALNSWIGEEFRPVGVDAAYTLRRRWTGAVTLFTGNDTLGALPAVRGWSMRDHWALLGEHLPVDQEYFTSVSAETDHHLGWAARGRWNNDRATVQLTHFDNRSDALDHGELFNWHTRFDIIGGDYTSGDWTVAGEYGWGPTDITVTGEGTFRTDLEAGYVLVSRRLANGRVSLRGDVFAGLEDGQAITAAYFWSPRGKLRAGIEGIVAGKEKRLALELRYSL
jgi:hypothetical protein